VRPDPWTRLSEEWPAVEVHIANLPSHWGLTVWCATGATIYLSHTLRRVQRRVVLAHELQHLERGQPCAELSKLDEARVVAATARWLLPDFAEVCELLAEKDVRQAAAEMQVTRRVLTDRLDDMNAGEVAMLGKALGPM
jgi:hypothetical protein